MDCSVFPSRNRAASWCSMCVVWRWLAAELELRSMAASLFARFIGHGRRVRGRKVYLHNQPQRSLVCALSGLPLISGKIFDNKEPKVD